MEKIIDLIEDRIIDLKHEIRPLFKGNSSYEEKAEQIRYLNKLLKEIRALANPRLNERVLPISDVRLSLPFNDLYKELDDKRMPPHIDSEGVWHLYKKQTAEHLLDNYDIYHKGERQ